METGRKTGREPSLWGSIGRSVVWQDRQTRLGRGSGVRGLGRTNGLQSTYLRGVHAATAQEHVALGLGSGHADFRPQVLGSVQQLTDVPGDARHARVRDGVGLQLLGRHHDRTPVRVLGRHRVHDVWTPEETYEIGRFQIKIPIEIRKSNGRSGRLDGNLSTTAGPRI